ncbi:tetratricopeptide repeat protein [Geomonas sp. Red51]|nr:tetratricopeptide repeat protein [Geomonas azotofigens]
METSELVHIGQEELDARRFPSAMRYLQAALERQRTPDHLSLYALALVQATGNVRTAVAMCQEAIKREPRNSEHFLRLGTVYLVAGRKKEAIRALNLGLRVGKNQAIMKLLQTLGHRESPVIPFLSRGNPLNKYLGKIRNSLFRK